MTELSKERRDAIRRELDDPSVDFEPYDSTVRALLDLADERDRDRDLLRRARGILAGAERVSWQLVDDIDAALEGKNDD